MAADLQGYEPATEGIRETLCTLAIGYWGSRGAAPDVTADGIHYSGTYLAGVYNRLDSDIAGTLVRDESIVNVPNWLPLTMQHADGTSIDADHGAVEDYRQELDLRRGLLMRTFVHRDAAGRATRIAERRLVSQASRHVAALEVTVEALNWAATVHVRSVLDADVANTGVAEYRHLASRHLQPVAARDPEPGTVLVESVTSQSGIHIALAARTVVHAAGERLTVASRDPVPPGHRRHRVPGRGGRRPADRAASPGSRPVMTCCGCTRSCRRN